ncbi:MAG TPA: GNAT family N-acetyltransferase [Aliicoccus persicus]|uniref:GNAT family N-acetyltransferase n=1 Tax=Aliicoccus persicus TaxID=930138 RepID=A0A921DW81_9STAP|nr:GNAT family N-acetyltransferase [Aliicoccus persicus]
MIYFKTKRLIFRDWKASDIPKFQRMNVDPDVRRYYEVKELDKEISKTRAEEFQKHLEDRGFGFFAVELKRTGEFIGMIGIKVIDENGPFKLEIFPCVEIRWKLMKKYWNQGYATEAGVGLIRFVDRNTNIHELYALFPKKNFAIQNVVEKIGMTYHSSFDHPLIMDGHQLKPFSVFYRKI